jgi:hypothetical protein
VSVRIGRCYAVAAVWCPGGRRGNGGGALRPAAAAHRSGDGGDRARAVARPALPVPECAGKPRCPSTCCRTVWASSGRTRLSCMTTCTGSRPRTLDRSGDPDAPLRAPRALRRSGPAGDRGTGAVVAARKERRVKLSSGGGRGMGAARSYLSRMVLPATAPGCVALTRRARCGPSAVPIPWPPRPTSMSPPRSINRSPPVRRRRAPPRPADRPRRRGRPRLPRSGGQKKRGRPVSEPGRRPRRSRKRPRRAVADVPTPARAGHAAVGGRPGAGSRRRPPAERAGRRPALRAAGSTGVPSATPPAAADRPALVVPAAATVSPRRGGIGR